ncbi:hypothetical protein BKA83DRAFT_4371158 [Pisolithus microcarpus]|nr:hypothetical protein BKA83DRAFT_4371158 [Pisolithus microcarpus]
MKGNLRFRNVLISRRVVKQMYVVISSLFRVLASGAPGQITETNSRHSRTESVEWTISKLAKVFHACNHPHATGEERGL